MADKLFLRGLAGTENHDCDSSQCARSRAIVATRTVRLYKNQYSNPSRTGAMGGALSPTSAISGKPDPGHSLDSTLLCCGRCHQRDIETTAEFNKNQCKTPCA